MHSIFLTLSAFLNRKTEEPEQSKGSSSPGSHLLCDAPPMEPPAPPGAGNRQAPPQGQHPFLPLSEGQGKPRSGEPFKPHLWDNTIITLRLPRTVDCQARQQFYQTTQKSQKRGLRSVDCSDIHPEFFSS